ncbi:MAG: hypothetical protein DLM69_00910 [Candidatus Chloroheliales bacterium]|nr:MAG: hypothetical protein DLM69_00910 [Chloroflexota bacterium]
MESKSFGTHSLFVTLLLAVAVAGALAGCDQNVQPGPAFSASDEAIRYTRAYNNGDDPGIAGEFALSAVDAQGHSRAITTLKEPNTDVAGIYLHIFAYGSGKLARFIPAEPEFGLSHGLSAGSPAQIEIVDLNTGAASQYQAPPVIDPYVGQSYFTTPFSPNGTQLIIPDRRNRNYYLLNLKNSQIAPIPNLKAFSIIGWSAADGLIYAHVIKLPGQGGGEVVEQVSPQGQVLVLNLPHEGNNIYDEILSPDGKELYYRTVTSTQALPSPDPFNVRPEENVFERYDIASGSSTIVARAAAGDDFSVGAFNFTLSSDGHSLAYVEERPTVTGTEQQGAATIWRVDLTLNSQPVKVIAGLNHPFRLLWCNESLYYYDGEVGWRGWHGMAMAGGKPVRIAGEVLGCAP